MKDNKNSDFFDLLCKNNDEELSEFLLSKGKSPKAICPIMFNNDDISFVNES